MTRRRLLLSGLLALLLPAGPAGADQAGDVAAAARALAHDQDPAARVAALERLAALGAPGRDALERALAHPDPDVRFHALYLLQEPDVAVERLVRVLVEGEPGTSSVGAATYPGALAAYAGLTHPREGVDRAHTRAALLRIATRYAGRNDLKATLYVTVSLDLVHDLLAADRDRLGAEDAARLAALCEVDLGDGFYELVMACSVLPEEHLLAALRTVLGEGSPLGRARAARVLAEAAPPARAPEVLEALRPLLTHPTWEVRLAAIQAHDVLRVGGDVLTPAAALSRDARPEVAAAALRLAGERGIIFVREAAERIVSDAAAPPELRREAARTLGLLGQPGSAPVLAQVVRAEASGDRELRLLAAWALGATRYGPARDLLLDLAATPELAPAELVYHGLARLGPPGEKALRTLLEGRLPARSGQPEQGGGWGNDYRLASQRRVGALKALARRAGDAESLDAIVRLVQGGGAQRLSRLEVDQAVRALEARADEPGRAALGRLLLEGGPWAEDLALDALGRAGGPMGDAALTNRVTQRLVELIRTADGFSPVPLLAAMALAACNPTAARTVLRQEVEGSRFGRRRDAEFQRHYARLLAKVGEPSFIDSKALPVSRQEVANPQGGRVDLRADFLNNVGIDLLYAKRLDQANLEFRRMLWCDPRNNIASYNLACGYSLGGEVEDAIRYLRRSIDCGYDDPRHMRFDSDLFPLHPDPRFQVLLERLRLAEEIGLEATGRRWP